MCSQNQRQFDKFKKNNIHNGFKTVASYPPDLKTRHVAFYEQTRASEASMRAHEEDCQNRPINRDMASFFEMVHTSVTTPEPVVASAADNDKPDDALVAELLADFGTYSSDDDDESRVTNDNEKQQKRKSTREAKTSKRTAGYEGTLADLTIEDIILRRKYAIMETYENDTASEGEGQEHDDNAETDQAVFQHDNGAKRAHPTGEKPNKRANKVS